MNFIRAIGDAESANGGVHPGQRKIIGDTGSAVHLNGLIDDAQSDVRDSHFDLRDLALCAFCACLIDHPSGFQSQQTRLLDHNAGVGDHINIAAQLGEAFAKRDPRQ